MSDGSRLRQSWHDALTNAESLFRKLLSANDWKRIPNPTESSSSIKGKARVSAIPELADVVLYRKSSKAGQDLYRVFLDVPIPGGESASLEPWKAVITTPELRQEWDPAVEEAHLIELLDQNTRICKTNFTLGWPANPRDAVTISRSFHDASTFIDISTSLPRSSDEPAYLRPSPPYVRSNVTLFAWCVQQFLPQQSAAEPSSSKRRDSLGPRVRITCFWQHDLRALWKLGATTSLPQQLCTMTLGLLKTVKKRGSRIAKLAAFGNGISIERIRFQIDREALTIDYAIVPEDEQSAPPQGLDELHAAREHRRLTRSIECILPSSDGWDVQLTTKASSEVVEKLPWSVHASKTNPDASSSPPPCDQILLRFSHAPLIDDHSVLKVRVVLEVSGPSSGLRLNGLPQVIEDIGERNPSSYFTSQPILGDVSSATEVSLYTTSSTHTGQSTLSSTQVVRTPTERPAAAEKSILSRVKRNYIYFSSLLQEPEAKWRRTTEGRGVSITQLDSIDPTLVVYRAEATFVGVGIWDLYGALVSPGARSYWDKQYEDAVLLEDVNELTELWHFKNKPAWPANGRDCVVLKTVYKSPTAIHVFAFSADDPHLFPHIPPVEPNIIRTQVDLQGWAIEALSPTTTLLTLLEQSDPKGWTNKTSIPNQMIAALAGIGEFAIKCGGPPVVTRLSGAKANNQRYDHERSSFRIEYEASRKRTGGEKSDDGKEDTSPGVECEIRCDVDTWASSLDVVVDPPPATISCLRRHRLSVEGGGLWLTLTHDAMLVDDERLLVIVRKGPGKEKGVVMVNGAKINVDVEELAEDEIKALAKRKRVKPTRVPLDQPPVVGVIRHRRAEWDADSPEGASPESTSPASTGWASAPKVSSPLAKFLSYAVEQATTTTHQYVAAISPTNAYTDNVVPSSSKLPMQYALDALAWIQDSHCRSSSDGWTLVSDKGIPIRKRMAPEISPAIPVHMGEKVIEGISAEELYPIISSFDCRKKWDDRFDSAYTLESFGAQSNTAFVVLKGGFPFRDRGFYLASIMARSNFPSFSRRSTGDGPDPSNGTRNAILCVSASFSPQSVMGFSPSKYNPYALPVGRVFVDAWVLETLDPYTKENYAIPSTRCSRITAVDFAGSIPVAVNSMMNATLPRCILSLEAYVKGSTVTPITRLPPPGFIVTDRKPDDLIAGLSVSSSSWKLRKRDETRTLLDAKYFAAEREHKSLIMVNLAPCSPRSPTVKPELNNSRPTPMSLESTDAPTYQKLFPDDEPEDAEVKPRVGSPTDASPPPPVSSTLETARARTSPTRQRMASTSTPQTTSPALPALPRAKSPSVPSVTPPPSTTSSRLSARTVRGRTSTSAFTVKGEVRPPADILVGEIIVDSKLYPEGYSVSFESHVYGRSQNIALDDFSGPSASPQSTTSSPPPSPSSVSMNTGLPVAVTVYTMPPSPLHPSTLGDDPSSHARHLVRFTLPTAQYDKQVSTVVDPLTGEVREAKEIPEWLARMRQGDVAAVCLSIKPLPSKAEDRDPANIRRRNSTDDAAKVSVEVDGAPVPVLDEMASLRSIGRDELLDDRAGKMCVLVRVPADADSLTLPSELQAPVAVTSQLLDPSSRTSSTVSTGGSTSSTPSIGGEDGAKQEDGTGNSAKEQKESDESQKFHSAVPLGRTPSGLLGFLNSYPNPWTRFAYSNTMPPSGDARSSKVDENAQSKETRIPGGLHSDTDGSSTSRVARSNHGTARVYPLSTVIIVALIAFLIGSLLRSLLSPADFVLIDSSSYRAPGLSETHGEDIGDRHPKEMWRELRRLVELKYLFGGWDFQIAVVRRH